MTKTILLCVFAFGLLLTGLGPTVAAPQDSPVSMPPIDASLLPYLRDGDVWLTDPAGRERWRLTEGERAWQPALSPDGRYLAYWSLSPADGRAELWGISLVDGARSLIAQGAGPCGGPAWSPDSRQLVWGTGDRLMVGGLAMESRALAARPLAAIAPVEGAAATIAWSADGQQVICACALDGARGLWAVDASDGSPRLLVQDAPDAWALSAEGKLAFVRAGALHVLENAEARPSNTAALPVALSIRDLPQTITALAWSPEGERLALADARGQAYVVDVVAGRCDPLPGAPDGVTGLRWVDSSRLACWAREGSGWNQTVAVAPVPVAYIPPQAGETGMAMPSPRSLPTADAAGALCAEVPYDWYRYQGEWDSGAMAHSNCGPTCVAMSIQFARDNLWVPISEIRSYMGGSGWTYPSQVQAALNHWQVPNQRLYSMQDIREAVVERGSIVLVHLWMYWFTPGSDYVQAYTDPAAHYGRYYSFDQSHWVVFKGLSTDGNWAICHDPNVWNDNGTYWYAGGIPKGKDRYYWYSELASSIADYDYQAIEVFASVPPTATPTATSTLSPTATRTPTPTPTLTPTVDGGTSTPGPTVPTPTRTPIPTLIPRIELLRNGGFEQEGVWSMPNTPARARRANDPVRSGAWAGLMGLQPGQQDVFSYSTIYQHVTVPADADSVAISFWYLPGTQEQDPPDADGVRWDGYTPMGGAGRLAAAPPTGGDLWSSYDWQRVMILDTNYQVDRILLTTCRQTDDWQHFQVELEGYAGQEFVLFFEVVNNGAGNRLTWMSIDDVAVYVPGQPVLWLPLLMM